MGKLSHKLRGEITQIGECTDALVTKFDDLVQYVLALEEKNSALKHTVSQLQLQQEDQETESGIRVCW